MVVEANERRLLNRNDSYILDLMKKDSPNLGFFRKTCKAGCVKITRQRLAIYKKIAKSFEHPSADGVFRVIRKKFPGISFDTVNRTLLTFADIGLIRVVEGQGDVRRFDPDIRQHHHLRCIKCQCIVDFRNKTYDSIKIPGGVPRGFSVLSKKVVLEGLCKKCR